MELTNLRNLKLDHKPVLFLGLGVLAVSYVAILLIDILNIGGSRSIMGDRTVPFLWNFLFTESGPIEMLQWTFLGGFAIAAAYTAGVASVRETSRTSLFWLWFSVAGLLMMIEDTMDIRNFFLRGQWDLEWQTLNILETFYFLILAAIPVYAVLRYGKSIKESKITVYLLALGFIFYGGAAFVSGPADLTSFNWHLGNFMHDSTAFIGSFNGEELGGLYNETDNQLSEKYDGDYMGVNHRFVDYLIEESLELLGSTMLLASSLSYINFLRRKNKD